MQVSKRPNPYSDKSRHMYNTKTQKDSELTGSINHIKHFR